jgi:hypothetical protein
LDSYVDALKEFPSIDNKYLHTQKGDAFHQKTDIFKGIMYFSYKQEPDVFIPMKAEQVKIVLQMNEKGEKPDDLVQAVMATKTKVVQELAFENVVGQDSLTRFDSKGKNHKKPHNKNKQHSNQNKGNANQHAKPQTNQSQKPQQNKGQNKGPQQNKGAQNQQKSNKPQHKPNPNQQHKKPNPNQNKPNKPNNSNENKSN